MILFINLPPWCSYGWLSRQADKLCETQRCQPASGGTRIEKAMRNQGTSIFRIGEPCTALTQIWTIGASEKFCIFARLTTPPEASDFADAEVADCDCAPQSYARSTTAPLRGRDMHGPRPPPPSAGMEPFDVSVRFAWRLRAGERCSAAAVTVASASWVRQRRDRSQSGL
jgi:hypothetical protein